MKDMVMEAREELKRIDHLVYVTLKYTRTVDVLLSIVERMITCYEYAIDVMLKMAEKEGKVYDIPEIPILKAQKVIEIYKSDKKIVENMNKYLLFRKIKRSNYEKSNEFRRHVTLSALIEGKVVEVNIDSITEDYHKISKFIESLTKSVFSEE